MRVVNHTCKQTTAEKDDDSGVNDFADEPDANESDEQSDSEESDDDGSIMLNDFRGKSFDISQTIDLESKDLLSMKTITTKTQPCVAAPAGESVLRGRLEYILLF